MSECDILQLQDDPFPVILAKTDSTLALNWVNHRCKGSSLGRALALLFVGLLIVSPLGINADWNWIDLLLMRSQTDFHVLI